MDKVVLPLVLGKEQNFRNRQDYNMVGEPVKGHEEKGEELYKAYLSVDLDFWAFYENQNSANRFFQRVMNLDIPTLFVIEHEELLDDINKSNLDILYNVDFHSDICSIEERKTEPGPTDGTWASYVKWRRRGHYHWIYPHYQRCYLEGDGLCNGAEDLNPFEYTSKTEWKKITHTPKITSIDWRRIRQVGVCLSPIFVDLETIKDVLKMFDIKHKDAVDLCKKQPYNQSKRHRGIMYSNVA